MSRPADDHRPRIGERWLPFPDVRRIAVLRGGGLGDLIFALPAVQSLAAAYPGAEITLLGAPIHAALLSDRPSPFTAIEVLPAHSGVQAGTPDPAVTEAFWARMRARRFDLAVQLHGGGRNSNPFLLQLGARHTVGTRTDDAAELERIVAYLYYQHEVLRALEVAGLAGAAAVAVEPRLPLTPSERQLRQQTRAGTESPVVVIHPGASDPRRRWPAGGFAEVAGALAAAGVEVWVVGDDSDRGTAADIVAGAGRPGTGPGTVRSAAGELTFEALIELFCRSAVVVANDSGLRHLAQALDVATVGIFWFGNVINAAPLSRARHRIEIGWVTQCPVCATDLTQVGWTAPRCEHDESMVADVSVAAMLANVHQLLGDVPVRVG